MDFDQLYPGKFMKAGEFGGRDLTMTVSKVKQEELGDDSEKEVKVIVSFSNAKKKLVLNKTNATCLMAMFGRESDNWVGKRVTFFPAKITDPFTGADILAIRVRGSPDIPRTAQYSANLARKIVKFTLQKTPEPGTAAKPKNGHAPVPSAGEPPEDVLLAGQEPPFPTDADAPGGI